MHPKANHLLLAAVGFAALTSCNQPPASPPVGNLANTVTAEPDISLLGWLRSTPLRGTVRCAMKPQHDSPEAPYFTFNNKEKPQTTCLLDGPYWWNDHQWYVLRIRNIAEPGRDSIRVCSKDAVRPTGPLTPFPSPCGDAGRGGCKICTDVPHQP